ncbi:hypothetical protein KCP74_02445 [Salmonella enterica subsp. enterica]|nr:hypothetical protein KCP74_02445 [Salmonella enterica subsp. enterica]
MTIPVKAYPQKQIRIAARHVSSPFINKKKVECGTFEQLHQKWSLPLPLVAIKTSEVHKKARQAKVSNCRRGGHYVLPRLSFC